MGEWYVVLKGLGMGGRAVEVVVCAWEGLRDWVGVVIVLWRSFIEVMRNNLLTFLLFYCWMSAEGSCNA